MRGIEAVGTVELTYVGRLLRMGGDSLLVTVFFFFFLSVTVWISVGDGFTGKGSQMCG